MTHNIILNTDSYKASHFAMYPPDCEQLSCYIESRGGPFKRCLFFGLQAFLRDYLTKPITAQDIDEAEALLVPHGLPFNRASWEYILSEHGGKLPLKIEAPAEGMLIPAHNVMMQITNTDEACYWLPTYLETALLRAVWYPTTVATLSWHCKQILLKYLNQTADTNDCLDYQLHDFGARGVSSYESASLGGMAHLVNFKGTDTLAAVLAASRCYDEPMAGRSVPATEHSTIISWGQDNEEAAYRHILKEHNKQDNKVSIVCDSYNIWHALKGLFAGSLKSDVESNQGLLIIRPDSGNPEEVVLRVIQILIEEFGCTTNSKGYAVLPDNLRVIQGDGVNIDSIESCLGVLAKHKISTENVVFGMGGALLQRVNRDTARFAMKANAVKRNGTWQQIKKDPITDPGKASKAGRLALTRDHEGNLITVQKQDLDNLEENLLKPVYQNGKILKSYSLNEVKQRAGNEIS